MPRGERAVEDRPVGRKRVPFEKLQRGRNPNDRPRQQQGYEQETGDKETRRMRHPPHRTMHLNQPFPRFDVPESAARLTTSTRHMLSSLGFDFGSKGDGTRAAAVPAGRGLKDEGASLQNGNRYKKQNKQNKRGGSGCEKNFGAAGAAATASAASAAASLVAGAAAGDSGHDFDEDALETMFYLAMSAERSSEMATHSRAERNSGEGQDFALANWKKVMLLLHRCLANALSKNVALLADNDKLAAELRRMGLELNDTKSLVSSLLAGQQTPSASDTAATAARLMLLPAGDQMATEVARAELEVGDTNDLVSSPPVGQDSEGGRPEVMAALSARDARPDEDEYRLAADLRRTELELEDTKNLVSSLLAGQYPDAGGAEMATAAPAEVRVAADKSQMAADLHRTTLELEDTKRLVSSLLAGQSQSVKVHDAAGGGGAHVLARYSSSMPVNGDTAGGGDNEQGHRCYSVHSRSFSDRPTDASSPNPTDRDTRSDSLNGSDGVLSTVAEGSEESSASSVSTLVRGSRTTSPVVADTTRRSTESSGGDSKLSFPVDSACGKSREPTSGFSRTPTLPTASPALGMEMSYPLPGNTEGAYLSTVRSRDPGLETAPGRQQGLQAGLLTRQSQCPAAKVAVCELSAPPPSAAPRLAHCITTEKCGSTGKSKGGTESLSSTGAVSAGRVFTRATSELEMPTRMPLVKTVKDGALSTVMEPNNNGCLSTAEEASRSIRAGQDPLTQVPVPSSCPPPSASNSIVPPTPSEMESMFSGMRPFDPHGTYTPGVQETASSTTPICGDSGARLRDARSSRRVRNVRRGHRRAAAELTAASSSTVLKELDSVRTAIKQDTSERIVALKTEQMAQAAADQSFSAAAIRAAPPGERKTAVSAEVVDRQVFTAGGGRRGAARFSAGARDQATAMTHMTRVQPPLPLCRLATNAGKRMRQSTTDKDVSSVIAPRTGRWRAFQSTLVGDERADEVWVAKERIGGRARVSSARPSDSL